MAPVYGFTTQLGIDTANPVTKRFDFQSDTLALHEDLKDTNGLRGTRARSIERVRSGLRRVGGALRFIPDTFEWNLLLPWVLGGTPTGAGTGGSPFVYTLAESMPTRFVTADRGANVFTYNGCVCDRVRFAANQGEPLEIDIDVIGIDETKANAGTFPVLNIDVATPVLMFYDLALTVNGVVYSCKQFELTIDHDIDKDRFFNSQTLTGGFARDRHVTIRHDLPFGDASAAYGLFDSAGGVSATAIFTFGSHILTMNLNNVAYPKQTPTVPGREEVMLPLTGTAYKSGAGAGTPEMTMSLVT